MNARPLKQSLSTFWSERNKREQNMLLVAGLVITLGLIYALLIDPAISGRADLEKKLPDLRQQAAEVQALAREAAGVSGATMAPPPAMTRESLESALTRNGMKAQTVSVSNNVAKVQLNAVPFSSAVEWLNDLQRTARITTAEAIVEAQAEPDMVNATLTLRQQRGESQ